MFVQLHSRVFVQSLSHYVLVVYICVSDTDTDTDRADERESGMAAAMQADAVVCWRVEELGCCHERDRKDSGLKGECGASTACCVCGDVIFVGSEGGGVVARRGRRGRWKCIVGERRGEEEEAVVRLVAFPTADTRSVLLVVLERGAVEAHMIDNAASEVRSSLLHRDLLAASEHGDDNGAVVDMCRDNVNGAVYVARRRSVLVIRDIHESAGTSTSTPGQASVDAVWECEPDEEIVQIHVGDCRLNSSSSSRRAKMNGDDGSESRSRAARGALLISTTRRSLVRLSEDAVDAFSQIGTKPRDGRFGACFHPTVHTLLTGSSGSSSGDGDAASTAVEEDKLDTESDKGWGFCARPGRRLWIFNGTKVEATLRLPASIEKGCTPLLIPMDKHLLLVSETSKAITVAAMSTEDTENIEMFPSERQDALRSILKTGGASSLITRIAVDADGVTLVAVDGNVLRWQHSAGENTEEQRNGASALEEKEENADVDMETSMSVPFMRSSEPQGVQAEPAADRIESAAVEAPAAAPQMQPRPKQEKAARDVEDENDGNRHDSSQSSDALHRDNAKRDSVFNTSGDWEQAVIRVAATSNAPTTSIRRKRSIGVRRKATPVTINLDTTPASSSSDVSLQPSATTHTLPEMASIGDERRRHDEVTVGDFGAWHTYARPSAESFVQEVSRALERDTELSDPSEPRFQDTYAKLQKEVMVEYSAALNGPIRDAVSTSKLLLPLLRWQLFYMRAERHRKSTSASSRRALSYASGMDDSGSRVEENQMLWTASFELELAVTAFMASPADNAGITPARWRDSCAMEFLRDHWNSLDVDRVLAISRSRGWPETEAAAQAFSFTPAVDDGDDAREQRQDQNEEEPASDQLGQNGGGTNSAFIAAGTTIGSECTDVHAVAGGTQRDTVAVKDDSVDEVREIDPPPPANVSAGGVPTIDADVFNLVEGGEDLVRRSVATYGRRETVRRILEVARDAPNTDTIGGVSNVAAAFHIAIGETSKPNDRLGGCLSIPDTSVVLPSEFMNLVIDAVASRGVGTPVDRDGTTSSSTTTDYGAGSVPWGAIICVKKATCISCGLPLRLAGVEAEVIVAQSGCACHVGCGMPSTS